MKNFVFLFLIFFALISGSRAQDYIYLKNGKTIKCHIVKDKIVNLQYKKYRSRDTTTYVIDAIAVEGYILGDDKIGLKGRPESTEMPKYLVAVSGVGIGTHYGGIGNKMFLGYKNIGVFMGVGTLMNQVAYGAGAQLSYRRFYLAYAYGVNGFYKVKQHRGIIYANTVIGGYLLNFWRERFFLDLGVGYGFSDRIWLKDIGWYNTSNLSVSLGFGIRFLESEKLLRKKDNDL